jgi:hypothetical protein
MKGILKRLDKAEAMRNDTVEGEFWSWPQVGKGFCFFKFANGKMRLIETAHVIRILRKFAEEVEFEVKDGRFKIMKIAD